MLMMRPASFAFMSARIAARQQWNVPLRFTSSARFQSASFAPSTSVLTAMPALLTRMCSPPSAAMISLKAASTAAESATSKRFVTAAPPAAATAAAASLAAASFAVKLMTTLAPARPSATAIARPMPRDPPVTTATRPESSPMGCLPGDGRLPERRNGRGIGRALDRDAGRDALHQAREDVPRAHLYRGRHAQGADALHRLFPAHRARDLSGQQLGDAGRVLVWRGLDVRDDRHARRRERHARELRRQPVGRGLHERTVEGRAHVQQLRVLRATRLGSRASPIDGPLMARD